MPPRAPSLLPADRARAPSPAPLRATDAIMVIVHSSPTLLLGRREEGENWVLSLGSSLLTDGRRGKFQDSEQAEMASAGQDQISPILGLLTAGLSRKAQLPVASGKSSFVTLTLPAIALSSEGHLLLCSHTGKRDAFVRNPRAHCWP